METVILKEEQVGQEGNIFVVRATQHPLEDLQRNWSACYDDIDFTTKDGAVEAIKYAHRNYCEDVHYSEREHCFVHTCKCGYTCDASGIENEKLEHEEECSEGWEDSDECVCGFDADSYFRKNFGWHPGFAAYKHKHYSGLGAEELEADTIEEAIWKGNRQV